jgi:voltage-gated potassium channel
MRVLFKLIGRLRFLFLFSVLMLFCFTKALDAQFGFSGIGDVILFILIAFSLALIGQGSKKFIFILAVLFLTELLCILFMHLFTHPMLGLIKSFFTMIYFGLMAAVCLRYTFDDKTIDVTTLFGSLSAYLFIGLSYAYLYLFINTLSPNSFSGLETARDYAVIYYSFTTLTTIGFGDVVPKTPITQTFAWVEAFTSQAYLAIIMAQLVGRYVGATLKNKQTNVD